MLFLVLFLCIEVVGEGDADVVVAEVAPRGDLLVGCLLTPAAVFVVENVVELQRETCFVLQDLPDDGAVPAENVAVHAVDGIASAGALGDVGTEDEVAVGNLGAHTEVVVPLGGVLLRRGGITQAVGIDLSEDGGFEPVVIDREGELLPWVETALAVLDALGLRGQQGEETITLIAIHAEFVLQTEEVAEALVEVQLEVPRPGAANVLWSADVDGCRGVIAEGCDGLAIVAAEADGGTE